MVTKAGQMWDEIAYLETGDCRYVELLMNANRDKLNCFIFPAGVELKVPEIPVELSSNLPAWRTENVGS